MRRDWVAKAALSVCAPLLVLGMLELLLRAVWSNPYQPTSAPDSYQTRIGSPLSRATVQIYGLYEGAGEVYGEFTRWGSLSNGVSDEPSSLLAIGGSTTQSPLVPEGERWPDLLVPPAMNFGVPENCVIDSYRNLRFLLEQRGLRPTRVLLMHAVNDLTEILRSRELFDLDRFPHRPMLHPLRSEAEQRVLGIPLHRSWLMSWFSFQYHELHGRDVTRVAPPATAPGVEPPPPLTRRHMEEVVAIVRAALPSRERAFRAIARLTEEHGARLVLLTQPHALRPDYRPYQGVDRRLRRSWRGRFFMSLAQDAALMDGINDHTRIVAKRLGLPLIDVAECLEPLDPSPLFFDSVHYTPLGSHAVADCVNERLRDL